MRRLGAVLIAVGVVLLGAWAAARVHTVLGSRQDRSRFEEQRAAGPRKRLVVLTFDDPRAFPWGGEPVLMDGRNVGEITSAGYSR
ncbi:MAG TPA: glycine cleavage T C-terminal barrel domain-containing protein, partial [Thermoanaerobaculia bacterium]|nr:glycine cleavage T C-terminal barrel domain-containing protein [Thermoanaerobaculia bacterium]